MSKQKNSGAVQVLQPGSYTLIVPGHDKPGKGMPKRCMVCRKPIKRGDVWRSYDNGQYVVIRHTACGPELGR